MELRVLREGAAEPCTVGVGQLVQVVMLTAHGSAKGMYLLSGQVSVFAIRMHDRVLPDWVSTYPELQQNEQLFTWV